MSSVSPPALPLPRGWPRTIKSAVLQVLALARFAGLDVRAGFESGPLVRARQAAEIDRLRARVAVLEEELRIKDARMAAIPAGKRTHYPPPERLAILTLRAATGWNLAETARRFLVTPATIASWMRRLDEEGAGALVALQEPVNRFPEFVAVVVRQLKAALPSLGKVRIAQLLARAGILLAPATVRRMMERKIPRLPEPRPSATSRAQGAGLGPPASFETLLASWLFLGALPGGFSLARALLFVRNPSRQVAFPWRRARNSTYWSKGKDTVRDHVRNVGVDSSTIRSGSNSMPPISTMAPFCW